MSVIIFMSNKSEGFTNCSVIKKKFKVLSFDTELILLFRNKLPTSADVIMKDLK